MIENSVSDACVSGETHLVVMTKFPEPGKVKTRLGASIGNEASCKLHRVMVQHLLDRTIPKLDIMKVRFHVAGGEEAAITDWLAGAHWQRQVEGDLGLKMQSAIEASFADNATKALIIGTDCPAITPEHIEAIVNALDDHDVAFTPALDGGYVMAGVKEIHPELYNDIEWSTETVLELSTDRLRKAGKSVKLLEALRDVDTEADLDHAADVLGGQLWK